MDYSEETIHVRKLCMQQGYQYLVYSDGYYCFYKNLSFKHFEEKSIQDLTVMVVEGKEFEKFTRAVCEVGSFFVHGKFEPGPRFLYRLPKMLKN